MYGVKLEQDTIQIKESNKSDLEALGYEVFKTRDDAETRGINWNIEHFVENSMPCRLRS